MKEKTLKSKILMLGTILICLTMLIFGITLTKQNNQTKEVFADTYTDNSGNTWTYTLDGTDATITGFSGTITNGTVTIPATLGDNNEYDVVGIIGKTDNSMRSILYDYRNEITNIVIPNSEKFSSIGGYSFSQLSNLQTINLTDNIRTIGTEAFNSCANMSGIFNLTNLESLGGGAFSGSAITSISFGDNLISNDMYTFSGCTQLNSVTFSNNFVDIADGTFYGCTSIVSLDLSNTKISEIKFSHSEGPTRLISDLGGMSNLTTLKLPSTLSTVTNSCFVGNTSLQNVYIFATTPPSVRTLASYLSTYDTTIFDGCTSLSKIYVPAESVNAYKQADGWSEYEDLIEAYVPPTLPETGVSANVIVPTITIVAVLILGVTGYIFSNNKKTKKIVK